MHAHNNVFKAKFPNKLEVQRVENFRVYQVPDRATDLLFDIWSSVEEPLYMLPEVWVQISGVPSDVRRDFLALWGLGTLFGKTKEVDMAFSRKNKVVRMLIGCVNHTIILDTMDVFVKRGFYKLEFMVESVVVTQDATMVEAQEGRDDDKDGNGDVDGNGKGAADMDMDDKSKNDNQGVNNTSQNKFALVGGGECYSNNGQAYMGVLSPIKFGNFECVPTSLGMNNDHVSASINEPNFSYEVQADKPQKSDFAIEKNLVFDAAGCSQDRFFKTSPARSSRMIRCRAPRRSDHVVCHLRRLLSLSLMWGQLLVLLRLAGQLLVLLLLSLTRDSGAPRWSVVHAPCSG
jgi:hypothetical protein